MFSDYDPDGDFEDEDRPLRRVVQAFTVLLLLLAFAVVLWFALERKHDEVEPDRNRSTSEQVEVSEDVENDGVEGDVQVTTRPDTTPQPQSRNVTISNVEISPNGAWITYVRREGRIANLWISARDGTGVPRQLTSNDSPAGIRHGWAFDNRHLLFRRQPDGLVALNVETSAVRSIAPVQGGFDVGYQVSPWQRGAILIEVRSEIGAPTDLYGVDLGSGASWLIENNAAQERYLADLEFHVRAGLGSRGGTTLIYTRREQEWDVLHEITSNGDAEFAGLSMGAGHDLVFLSVTAGPESRLLSIDLATGEEHLVAQHADAHIGTILRRPNSSEPVAYQLMQDGRPAGWHILDQSYASDLAWLERELGPYFQITSQSLDDAYWIVETEGDAYLYVRTEGMLELLNFR